MTTISSRPTVELPGAGPYILRMTREQLELIGALVYVTRLGVPGVYKRAAFELMGTLETLFDDNFCENSSDDVNLSVSHVDENETIIAQFHHSEIILEV